jgi:AcrR family transcriptional regulator
VNKVNLNRRAEIGRERRARTRGQLVQAAHVLLASRPIASVTVEDVTDLAGTSKGAFYSHFRGLEDLWGAVAAELAEGFEDVVRANRYRLVDPVEGIAAGCASFIEEARRNPNWGMLIANGLWTFPTVAFAARERLKEILQRARRPDRLASFSEEVGFDLVVGVVIQAMRSASEAKLSSADVADLVQGILRALGVNAEDAEVMERRAREAAKREAASASHEILT